MIDSLLAITPLFILISLGYIARRTLLDVHMLPAFNQFVYYFAVPALLFNAARGQSLQNLFYFPGLLAFILGILLTLAVSLSVSRYLFGCQQAEGLILRGLNSVFANYAYMGIPLTFGLLGEASHAPSISIILAANVLLIGGAQLLLEMQSHRGTSVRQVWRILDHSLLRSSIFLSTVVGLAVSGWHIPIPHVLDSTLNMLAPAAIPVALFCLGASLEFRTTNTRLTELAWLIGVKLLLHPALTCLAFKLLHVQDPAWLMSSVLLTALPTGALVHVVAMRYNIFEKASSQMVVFSTLLSLVSVSIWGSLLS
ncbi:MAG: hypothetical protein CR991_01685 [Proteobacteria bacterium]|nr:MAG: hypothetical protein CR991_01685 [Pseudomonadota bacterium]